MKDRSIGLAVIAIVMLVAGAIYVLLNPLKWSNTDRPKPETANVDAPAATTEKSSKKQPDSDSSRFETASAQPGQRGMPQLGLFDVARIDPEGPSVFAGQAKPNEVVNVLVDGAIIGTATADANGDWVVITERKIATADPKLAISYGRQPPVPGRLASGKAPTVASVRTASIAPSPAPSEPRTVRDVEARTIRELGDLVDAARRAQATKGGATGTGSDTGAGGSTGSTGKAAAGRDDAPATGGGAQSGGGEVATARVEMSPTSAAPGARNGVSGGPSGSGGGEGARTGVATAATGTTVASAGGPGAGAGAGADARADAGSTLPVPIRFVYREATFTEHGKAAAVLLLEYLRLKKINSVTLTGHADERGSHDLNMELSAARLKAVETFLRTGGYGGELKLTPLGKTEPFSGVDRARFDRQALYELDRRVELKVYR